MNTTGLFGKRLWLSSITNSAATVSRSLVGVMIAAHKSCDDDGGGVSRQHVFAEAKILN